jgi:hypothetical protein
VPVPLIIKTELPQLHGFQVQARTPIGGSPPGTAGHCTFISVDEYATPGLSAKRKTFDIIGAPTVPVEHWSPVSPNTTGMPADSMA